MATLSFTSLSVMMTRLAAIVVVVAVLVCRLRHCDTVTPELCYLLSVDCSSPLTYISVEHWSKARGVD